MKVRLFLTILGLFLWGITLQAQPTREDYQRADSIIRFNDLVYNQPGSVTWADSSLSFWYSIRTPRGTEFMLVDARKLKSGAAFDQEKLCRALLRFSPKAGCTPFDLGIRRLNFTNGGKTLVFEHQKNKLECDLKTYQIKKLEDLKEPGKEPYWGITREEQGEDPVDSPDSLWQAFIKDYNVFIRSKKTRKIVQLSFDGCSADYYSCYFAWSPDSKYLAVNKIRKHEKQYIHFVESAPKGELQPKLQEREYLKPGDVLPVKRPCLFSIERKEQIPVDTRAFENQFDLSGLKWWPDSKSFTFEFNQRGHQCYQVVEVEAATGLTRIIIEEKFDTYVEYSGKHYRYDIDSTQEIIWASERDGWNHLYLIDGISGQVKHQITRGEWVVREVVHVDEAQRTIIFKGSGKNQDEDPYFIHYYRVGFDGSDLTDLTPVPGEHQAVFSFDYAVLVDTYSTVTNPPVTVLRSGTDGRVLMPIETADISELLARNWKKPEIFVAKGRDGKTDIWGNIYFPTNFDPTKTYPVIEYIYAGPQGAFVQKSFRPASWAFSGLAELGFVIVSIDGMGTSFRSKAFQDVCFKNLKDAGFPDRILWMKAAAETRSYMDLSRVGIFGGSAGGQNSTAALLFYPDFYKVAVSSCGCHDNRMDKMWWNEQWMGYPIGSQYRACSNTENAKKLEGRLMLIVGEMDDNVDPSSTIQLADALIKAHKDFELVVLPGVNHTLGGDYGERKRRDFFVRYLYSGDTPDWNKKDDQQKDVEE